MNSVSKIMIINQIIHHGHNKFLNEFAFLVIKLADKPFFPLQPATL